MNVPPMRRVWQILCIVILGFGPELVLSALTFDDDFSSRRDGWHAVGGKWAWEGGKLVQTAPTDSYCQFVRDEPLTEGVITVEAAATAPNSCKDGCVGIVCKHIDKDNWIAIRFGAYKGIMALMSVAGKKEIVQLRPFTCKVGRRYTCEVQMTHGIILATLDGKTAGVIPDPFKGQPGRPGVFAQSPAAFYRFKVDDKARVGDVTSEAKARFASGPRVTEESKTWRLEAVEYSVAPLAPTLRSAELCTLALYLRNRGAETARVTDIALDGTPSAQLIQEGRIAWWRSWPENVPPGGLTQVLAKMSAMTLNEAAQAALKSPVGPYRVRLESSDRRALGLEFALDPSPPPLRVNFIAFDSDLKNLHVYLAATGNLVGKAVGTVEVNGMGVSAQSGGTLRPDTLPLRIQLDQPLPLGAPTLVTVRAAGGAFAGHAVRAFPARFPLQVVILGKQPGPDEVKELAELCFTDVGLCGGKLENIPEMKKRGLLYFPYAYPYARSVDAYLGQPARPELSAWWIDEIDGWQKTPWDAQQMLVEADAAMRQRGLPLAPYCMNIMSPWDDVGYIELADALSHEYGIDFGIKDLGSFRTALDFGAPRDLTLVQVWDRGPAAPQAGRAANPTLAKVWNSAAPAAHARAIVCGHDTVVLLTVNLNIDSNFHARQPQPVKSYEPVAVDVELDLPPWLTASDVFEVSCKGLQPLKPARSDSRLRFAFPNLAVSSAVVITSDKSLQPQMAAKLQALRAKLQAAGVNDE